MNTYRVVYTTYLEIEANDADEALDIAADINLNAFVFLDAEVEEIEK